LDVSPRDDIDYERLARYFSGECPAPEAAAIRAWIAADETRRHEIEQLRQAWEAAGGAELRGDLARGWEAISARMDDARAKPGSPPRSAPVLRLQPVQLQKASWFSASRTAAAIVIAVGIGAFAARHFGWGGRSAPPAPEMREVSTRRGQQANVYLSDGTRVVLGVESTLRFPMTFHTSRDVELDGEAYFEVAHDTSRSFAVHMQYGTARDLGTKFVVRAYRDNAKATVTVTEGAVVVTPAVPGQSRGDAGRPNDRTTPGATPAAPADSLVLGPLEAATVTADGDLSLVRGHRTDANVAWVSGRVVFDRMPVPEAIAQINRWYDADVRLGDPTLGRYTLSASLTTEPFPEAIRIIAAALDARVERRDSTFTLFRARPRN
jgi:ferric-dicitrate binding protein FerR (iron transport regulator)